MRRRPALVAASLLIGLGSVLVPAGPVHADHLAVFSKADYRVNEDVGKVLITVQRPDTKGRAYATYATADGTATAGKDYTPASGSVTFADGEREKTFTVAILRDGAAEGDETVTLTLQDPGDGIHGGVPQEGSTAVLTVVGNDGGDAGAPATEGPAPEPPAATAGDGATAGSGGAGGSAAPGGTGAAGAAGTGAAASIPGAASAPGSESAGATIPGSATGTGDGSDAALEEAGTFGQGDEDQAATGSGEQSGDDGGRGWWIVAAAVGLFVAGAALAARKVAARNRVSRGLP